MRVKDLMTESPCTVHVNDTASAAASEMWEHDCGIVPVVDDSSRVVGVVTDRDLCMAAFLQGLPLAHISVASCMTRQVWACHPNDTVEDAERLMSEQQVHRVPVVGDNGEPIGVLSVTDLVRQASRNTNGHGEHDPTVEVLRTVAAIGRPRNGDARPSARA